MAEIVTLFEGNEAVSRENWNNRLTQINQNAETAAGAQEKADAAKAAAIAASDPKGSAAAVSTGVTGGTTTAA